MRTSFAVSSTAMLATVLAAGLSWAATAAAPVAAPAGSPPPNPAMDKDIAALEHEWAHITYQVPDSDQRFDLLQPLVDQAAIVAGRYPNRAEPLIWAGIIISEEAADASMLNALSHAEAARDLFERAEKARPERAARRYSDEPWRTLFTACLARPSASATIRRHAHC